LASEISLVDDLEENVCGVVGEGEVANLVDDEHVGVQVVVERGLEPAGAGGVGEALDELGGGGEASLEAILDGAVGDGDREPRLTGAGGSGQDEATSFGHELGAEERAEEVELDRGLEGEVEVLDGRDEREPGLAHGTLDTGLGAVGDLLDEQDREVVAVA